MTTDKKPATIRLPYNYKFFTRKEAAYYYFLGVSLTDGCISKQPDDKKNNLQRTDIYYTLGSKDTGWIEALHKRVGGSLSYRPERNGQAKQAVLRIFDQQICKTLLNGGCFERKSITLQFPNIPDRYFFDFLRGCFDGDGAIYWQMKKNNIHKNFVVYLCSASKQFLEDIRAKLTMHDITCALFTTTKAGDSHTTANGQTFTAHHDVWRITFGVAQAYKLVKLLGYKNNRKPAMPRKKEAALMLIEYQEGDVIGKLFGPSKSKISNEALLAAVPLCKTMSDLCRYFGINTANGTSMNERIKRLGGKPFKSRKKKLAAAPKETSLVSG